MSDELTWKKLASREGPELPLFRVRLDQLQHPTSARTFERLVLEAPDWVNVAAVTDEGRIVMVEQYRFGVEALTLEPVGGLVDAGRRLANGRAARARRRNGFRRRRLALSRRRAGKPCDSQQPLPHVAGAGRDSALGASAGRRGSDSGTPVVAGRGATSGHRAAIHAPARPGGAIACVSALGASGRRPLARRGDAQRPMGCQVVFTSWVSRIRYGLCACSVPQSVSTREITRFTLSAAAV